MDANKSVQSSELVSEADFILEYKNQRFAENMKAAKKLLISCLTAMDAAITINDDRNVDKKFRLSILNRSQENHRRTDIFYYRVASLLIR